MFEGPAPNSRLAVAALSEAGDAAALFRGPDGRPLQGYVLITGEGPDCRITVYLERGAGVPAAVLAGEIVWFQSEAADSPAAVAVAGAATWAGAGGPGALALGADGAPGSGSRPEPEPRPQPASPPASPDARQPAPDDATAAPPETTPGFKLYHEPATPVFAVPSHEIEVTVTPTPAAEVEKEAPAPVALQAVPLTSCHPLAPRGGGTARIDQDAGRLALTIRGLPAPGNIGAGLGTYRAWLQNQRTGARHFLGLLTRAWGDNYRLESAPDLPLSRFDIVVITADDRISALADAPEVLRGLYAER